jgi:hypothetical protein
MSRGRNRGLVVLAAACLLWATAGHAGDKRLLPTEPRSRLHSLPSAAKPEWPAEAQRAFIRKTLPPEGVKDVIFQGNCTPIGALDPSLPPEVLSALWDYAWDAPRSVSFHDAIAKPGGGFVPVWVTRAGATLTVRVGAETIWPGPPDRAALVERYGLGGVVDGDARWLDVELVALDRALATLAPTERVVLRGLTFRRDHNEPGGNWGVFHDDQTTPRVSLLDDSPAHARVQSFDGDPDAPLPEVATTLLHELGHAFAAHPVRDAWERWTVELALHEALVAQTAAWTLERKAHLARVADWRRRWDASVAPATRDPAAWPQLEAENDALILAATDLQARSDSLSALGRASGDCQTALGDLVLTHDVLEAYAAVPGAVPGPTGYAATHVEESFADAFRLWHLDPDALRALTPRVADWFANGGHVAAHDASAARIQALITSRCAR